MVVRLLRLLPVRPAAAAATAVARRVAAAARRVRDAVCGVDVRRLLPVRVLGLRQRPRLLVRRLLPDRRPAAQPAARAAALARAARVRPHVPRPDLPRLPVDTVRQLVTRSAWPLLEHRLATLPKAHAAAADPRASLWQLGSAVASAARLTPSHQSLFSPSPRPFNHQVRGARGPAVVVRLLRLLRRRRALAALADAAGAAAPAAARGVHRAVCGRHMRRLGAVQLRRLRGGARLLVCRLLPRARATAARAAAGGVQQAMPRRELRRVPARPAPNPRPRTSIRTKAEPFASRPPIVQLHALLGPRAASVVVRVLRLLPAAPAALAAALAALAAAAQAAAAKHRMLATVRWRRPPVQTRRPGGAGSSQAPRTWCRPWRPRERALAAAPQRRRVVTLPTPFVPPGSTCGAFYPFGCAAFVEQLGCSCEGCCLQPWEMPRPPSLPPPPPEAPAPPACANPCNGRTCLSYRYASCAVISQAPWSSQVQKGPLSLSLEGTAATSLMRPAPLPPHRPPPLFKRPSGGVATARRTTRPAPSTPRTRAASPPTALARLRRIRRRRARRRRRRSRQSAPSRARGPPAARSTPSGAPNPAAGPHASDCGRSEPRRPCCRSRCDQFVEMLGCECSGCCLGANELPAPPSPPPPSPATPVPAACRKPCNGGTCAAFRTTPCPLLAQPPWSCDCSGCCHDVVLLPPSPLPPSPPQSPSPAPPQACSAPCAGATCGDWAPYACVDFESVLGCMCDGCCESPLDLSCVAAGWPANELLPNQYAFSGGDYGNSISDGGSDMCTPRSCRHHPAPPRPGGGESDGQPPPQPRAPPSPHAARLRSRLADDGGNRLWVQVGDEWSQPLEYTQSCDGLQPSPGELARSRARAHPSVSLMYHHLMHHPRPARQPVWATSCTRRASTSGRTRTGRPSSSSPPPSRPSPPPSAASRSRATWAPTATATSSRSTPAGRAASTATSSACTTPQVTGGAAAPARRAGDPTLNEQT